MILVRNKRDIYYVDFTRNSSDIKVKQNIVKTIKCSHKTN